MKPLYMDFMEDFVFIDRTHQPDGQGGTVTAWVDGSPFRAALVQDSSSEVVAAQAAGAKAVYRVTADPSVSLEYHDVFRRVSDGAVFRVTSDSSGKRTPERASFQMAVCTAESWVIPDGGRT